MTIYTNAAATFGPSQFLVGTADAGAPYTTIASAVAAFNTIGGNGTLLIQPGTYTESIAWPAGLSVQGVTSAMQYLPVVIVGNQTFSASGSGSAGNVSFSGIFFQSTSGDCFTAGPSGSGSGTIQFFNCDFTASGGRCFVSSSASGTLATEMFFCSSISTSSDCCSVANGSIFGFEGSFVSNTGNAIDLGASGFGDFQDFQFGAAAGIGINLSSTTSTYSGNNSVIQSPTGLTFAAAGGLAISNKDNWYTSGSYFANASSSGPTLQIGDPLFFSGTDVWNPLISTTIVPGFASSGINTINSIAPLAGNFTLTAGSNITLTPGANSITIASTGGGSSFTWNSITASQTMVSNNGYLVASGTLSLALPTTSAVGDEIEVVIAAGTSWTITQAAGQSVVVGNITSTVGVSGSVASNTGQTISLVCSVANTKWNAYGLVGNLSVT